MPMILWNLVNGSLSLAAHELQDHRSNQLPLKERKSLTKILVIEDEATLREEVMDWLRSEGYEAFGAEDGMVGVEYAALHVPDLIVAHTATPRLDGYGVLLEMHANPLTARIPFIFLTAGITHEDRRKVKVWGADYYITKPFSRLEFLQAVQARLEKHTAQKLYQEQQIAHLQAALTQEHEERMLRTKLVAMFSHELVRLARIPAD